jgi:hypothetical protein
VTVSQLNAFGGGFMDGLPAPAAYGKFAVCSNFMPLVPSLNVR